jgi:Uma2 family endonuclease
MGFERLCYAEGVKPASAHWLVSEKEFLSLPESNQFIELLDGEVIMSPAPSVRHQMLVVELLVALRDWASKQKKSFFVGIGPQDIRFAKNRILQPDIYILAGKVDLDHKGPLDVVPLLCVEVASSNRVYDRVTKRSVYGDAGVREYWVVEPRGPVERFFCDRLTEREELTSVLASPLLPGFRLSLKPLFAKN